MEPLVLAARGCGRAAVAIMTMMVLTAVAATFVSAWSQTGPGDDAGAVIEADPAAPGAEMGTPEDPDAMPPVAGDLVGGSGTIEPRPLASPVAPVVGTQVTHRAVFDIGSPIALASFVRDDALWLVFSARAPLDGPVLARQGELGLGTALIAEARGGVALRFDNPGGRRPRIDRDGTAWAVVLPAGAAPPPPPLEIVAQPDHPDGARLFIRAADATRPVAFVDPAVGDILVAMPLISASRGIDSARRFAEFQLLPSILGIVLRPSIDDLRIRAIEGGVAITSESGLQLS